MNKGIIGLWIYRNEGGDKIHKLLKKKLETKGHKVITDFDMRECYCYNSKVYTKNGFDLSQLDILYHMNADEQTPYQREMLRALELSGVKIMNNWSSYSLALDKFSTNLLLRKNGINVPPSILLNYNLAYSQAKELFKEWKKICLKPRNKHHGHGIMLFEDPSSFIDYLENVKEYCDSFYLEKFIEFKDHDYRAEVFNGKVIGTYSRKKTHKFKTNIGSGGKLFKNDIREEHKQIALKAVSILGIEVCIVDMIQSLNDGKFYILEVNPLLGKFMEAFRDSDDNIEIHPDYRGKKKDIDPKYCNDELKLQLLTDYLDFTIKNNNLMNDKSNTLQNIYSDQHEKHFLNS